MVADICSSELHGIVDPQSVLRLSTNTTTLLTGNHCYLLKLYHHIIRGTAVLAPNGHGIASGGRYWLFRTAWDCGSSGRFPRPSTRTTTLLTGNHRYLLKLYHRIIRGTALLASNRHGMASGGRCIRCMGLWVFRTFLSPIGAHHNAIYMQSLLYAQTVPSYHTSLFLFDYSCFSDSK